MRLNLDPYCKILTTCTNSTDGAADTLHMCNEAVINDMHEAGFGNISSMGSTRILLTYIRLHILKKETLLVITINLYSKKWLTLWSFQIVGFICKIWYERQKSVIYHTEMCFDSFFKLMVWICFSGRSGPLLRVLGQEVWKGISWSGVRVETTVVFLNVPAPLNGKSRGWSGMFLSSSWYHPS